jgi:1,4-dihydroxy-2-naphthoate octaprenyltransferase
MLVFIALHFFLYPASNGYNSYFDKDEDSIGGLEKPPPVSKELYYLSLLFDLVALLLGFFISWHFVVMMFIYGLVSKAYSHPAIRLKKMAYTGWFAAGFFQGFFTFLMVYLGLNDLTFSGLMNSSILIPAFLTTMLLWGSYPMTQVYQHQEDSKRGDQTISLKLGIMGTFYFTAGMFLIANGCFIMYFIEYYDWTKAALYQLFLMPVLVYFLIWFNRVRQDKSRADFRSTMKLNFLSATAMNLFFLILWFWT